MCSGRLTKNPGRSWIKVPSRSRKTTGWRLTIQLAAKFRFPSFLALRYLHSHGQSEHIIAENVLPSPRKARQIFASRHDGSSLTDIFDGPKILQRIGMMIRKTPGLRYLGS